MRTVILIILGFCVFWLQSQTNPSDRQAELDSLWQVWSDVNQEDTIRLKAIDDLAWEGFVYSDPDSALVLAQLMLDFAVLKKLEKQQCYALNTLGICYWVKADYLKAISYYEKSKTLSEKIGNEKGVATALNNLGAILHNKGHYPKALNYFKQSLVIYTALADTHGIALANGNIGMIYREEGDIENALLYAKKSLKLYESINESLGIAKETLNIGNILASKGDYETGLIYYLKSLELREESGDKRGTVNTLTMIGTLLTRMDRSREALIYHEKALEQSKEMGEKRSWATALMEKGKTQITLNQNRQAINNCLEAYKRLQDLAIVLQQKKACNCLFKAYKNLGDTKNALYYYEIEQKLEDSLQITETAKKLQQMEFQKKLFADSLVRVEEERKINIAHEEEISAKEKTRNLALLIGGLVLLLASGLYNRLRFVKKSKKVLQVEKERSDSLLLNILPFEVAEELKIKGKADARNFDMVSILFTDFIDFTKSSSKLSARELVNEINHCFEAFDHILEKYKIEKIKTIGDSYMAAGGLPIPTDESVKNTVMAALEMQKFIENRVAETMAKNEIAFEMRVGIHTGPVVAGIVGVKKFQYDLWGDTVNTASRIENKGKAGKVNISQTTYELLKNDTQFTFENRGRIEVKGKGEMEMWFVSFK